MCLGRYAAYVPVAVEEVVEVVLLVEDEEGFDC